MALRVQRAFAYRNRWWRFWCSSETILSRRISRRRG